MELPCLSARQSFFCGSRAVHQHTALSARCGLPAHQQGVAGTVAQGRGGAAGNQGKSAPSGTGDVPALVADGAARSRNMNDEQLRRAVEKQVKRMQRAEKERPTLLAQSVFMGTLALLFVLPVIVGAYLGNWLDNMVQGYSIYWTIGLLLVGLVVGIINVYIFVREHD